MGRLDDEQSQVSEWSEIEESGSDSSDGFSSDDDSDELSVVSVDPIDGASAISRGIARVLAYINNDRFRIAAEFLATDPNGLVLLEARRRLYYRGTVQACTLADHLITRRDGSYRTLLHYTAAFESEPRVTEALLRCGANVNAHDGRILMPLHLAAKRANRERTIACLLEHGASVGAEDDMGRTPLTLAARYDHKSNCEALIAAGADVKDVDFVKGWTALKYAARQPSARCVAPLLDAGATLDAQVFTIAMKHGSTRGLYQLLRRDGVPRFFLIGGRSKNVDYMRRVHAAGGLGGYERRQRRKLVSLLRRHVAPRAPDDVLHVIVSFWGHAGSY